MPQESILISKLDDFIRKYYKNQLIKGLIFFLAFTLIAFLAITLLEYFGRYNSITRAVLFYSYLIFFAYCLIKYLIKPLASINKLGQRISRLEAAKIVGNHFPEINDKLLNTLQLQQISLDSSSSELLNAAIAQKTKELKPFSFKSVIDLKGNLRHIKYALVPIFLYVLIFIFKPGIISDAGERIVKYNKLYLPVAPFSFELLNKNLNAEQFCDLDVEVKLTGESIPNDVFIEYGGNQFKMEKLDLLNHKFTLRNLQKNTAFRFWAAGFSSEEFSISVVAMPTILNYNLSLEFPSYLKKKSQTLSNPGDLLIPAGTVVKWKFLAKHTNKIMLGFENNISAASEESEGRFVFSKKFFLSSQYFIKPLNDKISAKDSMSFFINVIADAFPNISVEEKTDSFDSRHLYFLGDINDDYGFTRLTFNYRFLKSDNADKLKPGLQQFNLAIDRNENSQRFYHHFNFAQLNIQPSDELEYYFEVWDNDGVHGAKSSKSKIFTQKIPSLKELNKETDLSNESLKDKMKESLKEAKDLQEELKELQRKMLDKKELSWEEKRKAENLLEKQKELNKKLDELKNEYKKNTEKEKTFNQQTERIMEKQQQIEKLYEELMTEDMKKLIKQIEDMLKLQNKDQLKNELDKMQLNNKDVEKELDRMLEMFKELQVEKKLEEALNNLDKLAEKQEDLSKKTEDKKLSNEENQKEQEKLNKEFDELRKDLKDIEKENKQLENPKNIEDTQKEEQEAQDMMQQSSDDLDKGNSKKSSQKKKGAANKMNEISEKKKQSLEKEEEEELDIDINALREILENLVQLSKDQEDLMVRFKDVYGYNPQFVKMGQEQKIIKENTSMVEDSLTSLSKRVAEIRSFVNREVSKMNNHLDRAITGYSLRDIPNIRTEQQYAMTSMNNLAVMLSEILKQLQQDMNAQMKSQGKGKQKNKKGQGSPKPSMSKLKKMQEELNKQLREGMNKNGSGEKGKQSSEQFARMAAQQQAIRQQLQKMMQEMGAKEKEELGGSQQLGELQKLMEQTEKELFNKNLTNEMLMRQQDILTRLLDSEKAERKQDQENKREAEQAREKQRMAPPSFDNYIKQKEKETELLKTVPAEMQPYYKQKAKEYLNIIR